MDDINQYLIEDDIFKSIEEEVICTICTQLTKNPVTCSKCQHSFCQHCIDTWKQKSKICPYKCNDPQYSKNRLINNLLSKLHFKCPNGCNDIISYDNFEKHRKECNQKIDYKLKYEKLLTEYNKLKVNYQVLEKTFGQYKQTMESQMKQLKEQYNQNLLNQQKIIQNQNINQKSIPQFNNIQQPIQNVYINKNQFINQNQQNQNSNNKLIKKTNSMNVDSSKNYLNNFQINLKSFPHFHKDSIQFSISIICDICEGKDNGILCKKCDVQICETCCKKILIAKKKFFFHEHELSLGKTKNMLCQICHSNYTKLSSFMICLKCNYYCCINCYVHIQ